MTSDQSEGEGPLFPLALAEQQVVQGEHETPKFQSFRAAKEAGQQDFDDLFSSDDEAVDTARLPQPPERKRSRDTPSQIGVDKKRQRKDKEEDSLYTDRKGDRQNLLYQGLYRLDVPAYRGSSQGSKLTNAFKYQSMQMGDRYFTQRHVLKERSKRLQRLSFMKNASSLPLIDMQSSGLFVSLDASRDDIEEEEGVLLESVEECVLRKTREFNAQLGKNPYDLSCWMCYADFQDEAVALTRRRVTTTSTAEKKVSILASALKYHPKSEELLCELLRLTSVFSSPEESAEKYQAMLTRLPHSIHLWRSYWTYTESSFAEFSCEKVRAIFEASMRGIEDGLRTRASVAIQLDRAEEELVEAFLCGVQFDFQSGFVEKGIAKIQASLEWNFCSPENKGSLSEESVHRLFKDFWETEEIPKIGEEGAQGFSAYADDQILDPERLHTASRASTTPPGQSANQASDTGGWSGWFDVDAQPIEEEIGNIDDEDDEEDLTIIPEEAENQETEMELMDAIGLKLEEIENAASISPGALQKFLRIETERSTSNFMPMKPNTNEELDVDRLVLFEELQPHLFSLRQNSAKKKLLVGSLLLIGVDVSSLLGSNDDFLLGIQSSIEGIPVGIQRSYESIFNTPLDMATTVWYKAHPECGAFVLSLFQFFAIQLFQSDIRIRKLWLNTAIELEEWVHQGNKRAKQVGRSVLELHKNDLNLWIAYASVLWKHGEEKESRRVWKAVFSAIQNLGQDQASLILASAVFEYLDASKPCAKQLHLLAYLATHDAVHLTSFLNDADDFDLAGAGECVSKFFKKELDAALTSDLSWPDYEKIISAVHCLALLSLQTTGFFEESVFFRAANSLLGTQLRNLPDRGIRKSRQCEALHEKYCEWMMKGQRSPKEVKQAVTQSLELYPQSPSLLMLLVQSHASAHALSSLSIDAKAHVFKHPTPSTLSVILLLEEVKSVAHLNVPGLFERVLKLKSGQFAAVPLIWRLYLQFIADQRGEDFKRVFLRSIRACPWSKAIWMKGLELSQGKLKGNEIIDFLETMKEKGVLLRTDIYEVLLEEAADMD